MSIAIPSFDWGDNVVNLSVVRLTYCPLGPKTKTAKGGHDQTGILTQLEATLRLGCLQNIVKCTQTSNFMLWFSKATCRTISTLKIIKTWKDFKTMLQVQVPNLEV